MRSGMAVRVLTYPGLATLRCTILSALTAIDLFSGAGGTTQGFRDAGYKVVAAIENDGAAGRSFELNHPETELLPRDITRVQAPALARRLTKAHGKITVLTACPPCQPFSTLGTGDADDPRNNLVSTIARFVRQLMPRAVVLENVPGLRSAPRYRRLLKELAETHDMREYVVQAKDFGVPQNRRRVIVLGFERDAGVVLPTDLLGALPDSFDVSARTAGDVLKASAELTEACDSLHRGRRLRAKTLERIKTVTPGGGRTQLPEHLQLGCHKRLGTRSATSIYGRIDPAKAAPTITTRCTTPSCGRFVHPTEDRGLTLREAALLQTFPPTYLFDGSYGDIERQIGNAVPPRLAEALGGIVACLLAAADEKSGSDIDATCGAGSEAA